jgi:hypothetical protein
MKQLSWEAREKVNRTIGNVVISFTDSQQITEMQANKQRGN